MQPPHLSSGMLKYITFLKLDKISCKLSSSSFWPLPSSSSRLAPPPVLTWLTLSSVSHLAQQVAVSPPPVDREDQMIMMDDNICKMSHSEFLTQGTGLDFLFVPSF